MGELQDRKNGKPEYPRLPTFFLVAIGMSKSVRWAVNAFIFIFIFSTANAFAQESIHSSSLVTDDSVIALDTEPETQPRAAETATQHDTNLEKLIEQRPKRFTTTEPAPPNYIEETWDLRSISAGDDDDEAAAETYKPKFHWKPALIQSGIFLGIQHSARMFQKKTTRELDGPFFRDWFRSVRNLRGWGDGDNVFINYVAHPLQGSVTGRIFVNNSDRASRAEFGKSKEYWNSRLKALVWSAAWDAQFELGPISEASIGNVGMTRTPDGKSTMSYVDLVITPTVGTGVLILEDIVDKYVLRKWLEGDRWGGKMNISRRIIRSALTPTTSFVNLLRGKPPWKRDHRL